MPRWIGLLRGVNVGGKNKMLMGQLALLLESIGCKEVRTYIQSGNLVFESAIKNKEIMSRKIVDAIKETFGFHVNCLLLSPKRFHSAIENNPFVNAVSAPNTLHFFFLESTPIEPDFDAIADLANKTELFCLIEDVFYLCAPDGIARSKLAAALEKKLGVSTTARNYNTVKALSSMLEDW